MTKARQEHNTAPTQPSILPEYRLWEEHWIRYTMKGLNSAPISLIDSYSVVGSPFAMCNNLLNLKGSIMFLGAQSMLFYV